MKLGTKITDLLFRRQKVLGMIIVFLFFSLVAFRFDSQKVRLIWNDYPSIALAIALIIAVFAYIWLKLEKQRTQTLIANLQNMLSAQSKDTNNKLDELSNRQREVFELILGGKSNKEITATLHIELSTLKTHINQLYKILDIKSRKEIKQIDKMIIKKI
jgi:DNA-binding CsgD family transcriptional regulator